MKKSKYDPEKIRTLAGNMDSQLDKFKSNREEIDRIIQNLGNNWDDENNTRFVSRYKSEAKKEVEDLEKTLRQLADILRNAGVRFAAAIDEGNSQLGQD